MVRYETFGEDFDNWDWENNKKKKKRILLKDDKTISGTLYKGIVITTKGRFYYVRNIEGELDEIYKCVVSGSLEVNHPHNSLVTVGDRCDFFFNPDDKSDLGRIIKVEERKTFLMRKSIVSNREDVIASNMEQVLILLAANNPPYNLRMLDKILVACEFGGVEPIICINKMDLADKDKVLSDFQIYSTLGYKVYFISALNKEGLEEVKAVINSKETLFIGVSGVGKSTLVNALAGKELQKVGKLAKNLRGRHTTTSCFYLYLDKSTVIIDSPGFREFELFGLEPNELPFYFPEFTPYFQKCKFQPCSHTHEPKCAVKNALKRGKISYERYISYLTIYENL